GEGTLYILRIGRSYSNLDFLYLEEGQLHITSETGRLRDASYSGGKLADYYNLYSNRPAVTGTIELSQQLAKARGDNDPEKAKELSAALEAKWAEQRELDKAFILKYKDSPAIVYPLYLNLRGRDNLDELERILSQLSPAAKNNLPVKRIEHSIRTEKLTGIG